MKYDIIEQVSELAITDASLEEKMEKAAGLLLDYFDLDQCAVYLMDGHAAELILMAKAGAGRAIDVYARGEGLSWRACEEGCLVDAGKDDSLKEWGGIEDAGFEGFRSAVALPIRAAGKTYGALVFKSCRALRLTLPKRQTARIAALQLVSIIRCSELFKDQHRVYRELHEMQQKLVNSEKLLALGDMAATMAHEIRNPLLSIGAFATRLKRQLPSGSPGLAYIDQMSADIGRIEKIMNGIIRFLKDNTVELKREDLNSIMDEAAALFSDEFAAYGIALERAVMDTELPVLADREQMKIAFDNLIANAIQSMEHGGTLTIITSLAEGFATAKIMDTGGGVDPRHMDCIFNPFFTTKKHGTGLGLPIAHSIVMRHKGRIEAANEGKGAAFTIRIPYAGAERASAAAGDQPS